MAQSKDTMVRLDRLEGALVHLTDVIVLQGERMELKDITEYREVLLRRLGKVDPKEAAAPSQTFEVVTAEVQGANLLFMYDMTGRGI